jgi:hypothetical protein
MAARLNPKHDARTREKIKTSQLINRLNSFALGEVDGNTGKPVDMSAIQVSAALGILKKTLPDLQATQITGEINTNYVARMPETVDSAEEWQKKHAPTVQ